jgi:hypothetical protein
LAADPGKLALYFSNRHTEVYTASNSERQGASDVAVKVVHVSDLSGTQANEEQFATLIVHEHPNYKTPITLEVLPDEVGELPEDEQYVAIELIQPGERRGRRAILSLDRFNKLASGQDMDAILMHAVAGSARRRGGGQVVPLPAGRSRKERVDYTSIEHAGRPHRGRITDAEKQIVRTNLDEVNRRLRAAGLREIDPEDPTLRERYGL